jgi:hypothetical protein
LPFLPSVDIPDKDNMLLLKSTRNLSLKWSVVSFVFEC